jgi:penicillin-binding protein 1B
VLGGVAATAILTLAGMAGVYFWLADDLDHRFRQTLDSVPSRVYSSPFWFRPGTGASAEELIFRLQERGYREVREAGAVASPGFFHLSLDENKRPQRLWLYTQPFDYPPSAKEEFFGDPLAVIQPQKFEVQWRGGLVESILDGAAQPVTGFSLEPVLVAQLNEGGAQVRRTVPLGSIPAILLQGIVLVEDQRFLEHSGIDPRGIARSLWVNLRAGGFVQGASTITQQLARNIYLTRERTLLRKIREMLMSLVLETRFSKDEILEKYLNEVYFGQSGNIAIHGVSEAAKFYFAKNLEELSVAEQALLIGLVRGPFFYSPFRHFERSKGRQEIVLQKLFEGNVITKEQYGEAKSERLKLVRASSVQNRAPYFTDMVQAQIMKDTPENEVMGAGFIIFSTIDTFYQKLAEEAVAKGVGQVEGRISQFLDRRAKAKAKKKGAAEGAADTPEEEARLVQGMFVAANPHSGEIVAMVGGRSYEESNYNRALLMRRHIGSLVKPYVYLAGLMYGQEANGHPISAISKFEDRPFSWDYDGKTWSPKNYEEDFWGTVTLRFALANSINTVAAKIAVETGLERVAEVMRAAGIDSPVPALPSLALGAIELPPLEVLTAYSTLANFGLRKELTATRLVLDGQGQEIARFQPRESRDLPPEEVTNLVQLMTSTFEIGTAKAARSMGFWWPAAGKTGTTNEFRDAWFAGFTRKLVALSWIGFDRDDEVVRRNRRAVRLTGAVAALPVWTDFMVKAHKDQEIMALAFPDNAIQKLSVDLVTGKKANASCGGDSIVEEYFTARNAPAEECP